MKKLFTLILVLVAFAINAKADDRTVITRIEVTSSDYESIVVAGGELKRPSISFTGGSPDPYYRLANFDQGSWRKKKGENSWEEVDNGVFTKGTWFFDYKVRCDYSTYVLSESTVVKINGVVCQVHGLIVDSGFSYFYVRFPEITITEDLQDGRTEIDLIEAVTTDYAQVAVIGGSVTNKPSASVLSEVQAQFKTSEGSWLETYDWIEEMQSYQYREQTTGTFESGNVLGEHAYFTIHYAFYCPLRVDGNWGKTHRLTENTVVKINGYECNVDGLVTGTDYSYCWVRWPDIIPQKPIPNDRTVITRIEVTSSDYESIVVAGGELKRPSISFTGGSPDPYYRLANFDQGSWRKKKGENSWEEVDNGVFTKGTWFFDYKVRCDYSTYVLSESTVVKINGVVCQVHGLIVDSGFSYFYVRFPEITIEDKVLPTGITLNQTSLTLNGGQTYQLQATVLPSNATDKTVTWYSTNTNVATVNNTGLVTGQNDGKATIVAMTSNGKTATCEVKVDASILPTSITLNESSLTLSTHGQTYQLTATIQPSNASDKTIYWSSNNEAIATVDNNGLVTAVGNGVTYIYASTSNYLTASCTVKVENYKEGFLGTKGFWRFEDGVLTIDYDGQMPQNCTKQTTDPEIAYRLKWIDLMPQIKEIVVTGVDVEIQPYFLYYEGDGDLGQHPDDHVKKLTLGSGVKKVGKQALTLYDLKDVYCYGIEPPELSSDTGGSNCFWKSRIQANVAFLHLVPGASTNYFRTDREWINFNLWAHALDPADDPVKVVSPLGETEEGAAIYDLSGRKLDKPQKGINIIRYSDGTTKKLLIK